MTGLGVVCVGFGVLMVGSRGPLIIWPLATREHYLKLIASSLRIRLLGLVVGAMAGALIYTATDAAIMVQGTRGSYHALVTLMLMMGWGMALAAVFGMLMFSSLIKLVGEAFWMALDDLMLRGVGILGVAAGGFFIYLGAVVFGGWF